MRDRNFKSGIFLHSFESCMLNFVSSEISTSVLSRIVPRLSEESFENSFCIRDKSLSNLVTLSILSWYLPEEIGILLRMDLKKCVSTDIYFLEILLESKAYALTFLMDTSLWHTRDFFGNIISKKALERAINSFRPRLKTKKKSKRTQRVRGYRDKGTMRKIHEKHDLAIRSKELREYTERKTRLTDSYNYCLGIIQ